MKIKKVVKKIIIKMSNKNAVFRYIVRKIKNAYEFINLRIITLGIKTDKYTILFSCYGGKSYSCSPKAIYEYMLSKEKYNNYQYVWAFREPKKYIDLLNNSNTRIVEYGKKEYKKYLVKSKYWIFNYKIPDYIYPQKKQIFVQCWHGTPFKRLGYDLNTFDNALNSIKGIKKRYKIEAKKFTYFISPSKFATEKFISAWNLKSINKENIIIEKGYPRNDFLYNYTDKDIEYVKEKIRLKNDRRKIILYAPTYRGNQYDMDIGYVYKDILKFDKLQEKLEKDFIILFRAHYFIANKFDFNKYKGFIYDVSENDDINQLYIISDILITDYSSVMFDFVNLNKPIIFHMYDKEYYKNKSNGVYINFNELPGNITKDEDELVKEIYRIKDKFVINKKYMKFKEKYTYLDDGKASQRVVEEIIDEENKKNYKKNKK